MESPLLYFSPTVNYAGQPQFCPPAQFVDRASGLRHAGRTLLAVTIEPASYKVAPAGAGVNR